MKIFMHPDMKIVSINARKGSVKFAHGLRNGAIDIIAKGAAAELMSEITPLVRLII